MRALRGAVWAAMIAAMLLAVGVPLSAGCVVRTVVTLSRRRVGTARRLSVGALFNGNSQIGGSEGRSG